MPLLTFCRPRAVAPAVVSEQTPVGPPLVGTTEERKKRDKRNKINKRKKRNKRKKKRRRGTRGTRK